MSITRDDTLNWIKAVASVINENSKYLTELDAAIGDADHGINMDRGFNAVKADLEKNNPADLSALLKAVGMALIRSVGGAAGPLYGTFFLRASSACADKTELDAANVVALFEAGLEGIIQRGKAELAFIQDSLKVETAQPA